MTPIHLILDASAVAALTSTVDVGEVLEQVRDNDAGVAVPVVCLTLAAAEVGPDLLGELLDPRVTQVADLHAADWAALAAATQVLGTLDAACALREAERHDCVILTAAPDLYAASRTARTRRRALRRDEGPRTPVRGRPVVGAGRATRGVPVSRKVPHASGPVRRDLSEVQGRAAHLPP